MYVGMYVCMYVCMYVYIYDTLAIIDKWNYRRDIQDVFFFNGVGSCI